MPDKKTIGWMYGKEYTPKSADIDAPMVKETDEDGCSYYRYIIPELEARKNKEAD